MQYVIFQRFFVRLLDQFSGILDLRVNLFLQNDHFFWLYFVSFFLHFRDPGATFLGVLEVLGPSWRLLGCLGGFGEHFGRILGRFGEGLGSPWGHFWALFSMIFLYIFFVSHFDPHFNDFPSILGGILGGFWDTFLEPLI